MFVFAVTTQCDNRGDEIVANYNIADSDGDGYNNDIDNCPTVSNREQEDMDNNMIGDLCQDYDADNKPFAIDSNNNGIAEANEYGVYGTGTDIDDDGDGLIEIWNINMLYNARYNLVGNSYRTHIFSAGITTGCGGNDNRISQCHGYEIVRDLDFNNDSSYTSTFVIKDSVTAGNGWDPIGSCENNYCRDISTYTPFSGTF